MGRFCALLVEWVFTKLRTTTKTKEGHFDSPATAKQVVWPNLCHVGLINECTTYTLYAHC